MFTSQQTTWSRREARGISVMIVALAMVFILGMAGMAIDLASLYVGRSQAQRSADAAALAGAEAWANDTSCISGNGSTINSNCQNEADQQAEAVGEQNLVGGVVPNIQNGDISFDLSNTNDPQITVTVRQTLPTYFIKIFGVDTANVSARATAEAFNPSGTGIPIGVECVKPWFFANCDQYNTITSEQNTTDCSPSAGYYVLDNGTAIPTVAREGAYPTGVYGEPITMKPGSPGSAAAPGEYYAAYIPNTTSMPTSCPSCANTGGSGGGGTGSAAVYRANIECCNENPVICGVQNVTIASSAGNMVGPTNQGVECLIQQSPGCGQDYLQGVSGSPCTATSNPPQSSEIPTYPFTIIPGQNNQMAQGLSSIPMSESNSVVSVPIYKGVLASGQNSVDVIGFMKLFIKYVDQSNQGTVYGYVLDVTACGPGGSGSGSGGSGSGSIIDTGATVPVRLIRTSS